MRTATAETVSTSDLRETDGISQMWVFTEAWHSPKEPEPRGKKFPQTLTRHDKFIEWVTKGWILHHKIPLVLQEERPFGNKFFYYYYFTRVLLQIPFQKCDFHFGAWLFFHVQLCDSHVKREKKCSVTKCSTFVLWFIRTVSAGTTLNLH